MYGLLYSVDLVPTTHVDEIWPHVADGLEFACKKTGGDITASYLWGECRGGHAYLCIVRATGRVVGASVWRFEDWTTGRKFRCLGLYGKDFAKWRDDHVKLAKRIMEQGGADSIVTAGRKGWGELFPDAKIIKTLYEWKPA